MKKQIIIGVLVLLLMPVGIAYAVEPIHSVYRFWSNSYKGHFYTASAAEAASVDPNWAAEGAVFKVYDPGICFGAPDGACLPVFRFWSEQYRHHFYTISLAEKENIIATMPEWHYEGVVYAAATYSGFQATMPLYRFYSDAYKGHFYTISATERDHIAANMPEWRYEGVAYYVIDPSYVFAPE